MWMLTAPQDRHVVGSAAPCRSGSFVPTSAILRVWQELSVKWGIAVPLLTADWTPNAQGYHGTFEFSRCPKSGLEQTFGNDTSQLQSFDHLQTHTLSLPTELDAWPFMTGFQFFGVLLYNDDSLVVSPARTINAVWNVPGNSCVYFEFQVVSPGDTVPSGADPCNPPVAKLSFAGIDALRTDYGWSLPMLTWLARSALFRPRIPENLPLSHTFFI
ncbi:hypothetical protein BKA62DRAFT_763245, partial [Auriculariales sp. MPI-PUGE-AT-0066]